MCVRGLTALPVGEIQVSVSASVQGLTACVGANGGGKDGKGMGGYSPVPAHLPLKVSGDGVRLPLGPLLTRHRVPPPANQLQGCVRQKSEKGGGVDNSESGRSEQWRTGSH